MPGQGNDFFLQFGSDAEPFSRQLASDLEPGIAKINALREALAAYEEQAARSKGGSSPLGITFEGLDAAAARMEKASADFSRQFGRQIEQLSARVAGLAEILTTATRTVGRRPSGGQPVGGPTGNIVPVTGTRPVNRGNPATQGFTPEQLAILDRQRRDRMNQAAPNATRVTPADQAAAQRQKKSSEDTRVAANAAADANSLTAKQVKATATALSGLNDRLQELIQTAKLLQRNGKGSTADDPKSVSAEGALQIGNTTANPVPVVVVGGEAQAVAGQTPTGPQATIPHATTATQTARAKEEVQAAELVNAAPNTRRNPSRVTPGDPVRPGEYFLLPGDDAKQPRRAYGIRPGETAGQYVERVDAVRERERGYLSRVPKLSDYDQERVRLASEAYGPFPEPKIRIEPGELGKSAHNEETVNARALPRDVAMLLRRRDLHAAYANDQARAFILDELRRDPMLTQDGLGKESKGALRQIDEAILALQNRSQAARLFESNQTPDLDALRQGATRRRYLSDTGSAKAEQHRQERYIEARFQEVQAAHDQSFESSMFLGQIGDNQRQRKAEGIPRRESIDIAAAQNRIANILYDDIDFSRSDIFGLDPERRKSFFGQVNRTTGPMRAELTEKIRRARRNVTRFTSLGRQDLVEKHTGLLNDLQSQLDSITPKYDSETELLRAAAGYRKITGDKLASLVVDQPRPESATKTEAESVASKAVEAEPVVEKEPSRRRGRRQPIQAEDQAVTAVREATDVVAQVKAQIHDLNAQLARTQSRLGKTRDGSKNQQKLQEAVAKLEQQKADLQKERTRLNRAAATERRRQERAQSGSNSEQESGTRPSASSGNGGNRPPTTPPTPPVASEPEPEGEPIIPPPVRRRPRREANLTGGIEDTAAHRQNQFNALDEQTRQAILAEHQNLAAGGLSQAEQLAAINRAALAFRSDSQYNGNKPLWGGGTSSQVASERVRALTGFLGLDTGDSATRRAVQLGIQQGASALRSSQSGRVDDGRHAQQGAQGENELSAATERAARMEDILASSSGRLREVRLAEFIAEENLTRLRASESATIEQIARAEMQLSAAQRSSIALQEQEAAAANRSAFSRITGRRENVSFGQDLVRHGSYALTNTIGYSLVFTGFEKLRDVVQTGIEAQGVFVRLQASLDANGISAGNLSTALAQISATTATPLEQVIEAASELSGTLKSSADIEFGTNIASQLANISQGALSAKEAAVGLRDVIAAYGDEWAKSGMSMQQGMATAGDQIAHLSQLTGVSVKDITEGTTQIAQEAHEFGLSQRQAATLAAYIAKGTGESGEESAAQASRMLATLYNGKTQNTLESTRLYDANGQPIKDSNGAPKTLATQAEFEQGKVGEVLQSIAANWENLTPRERQQISSQMGTGIQARAFSAYVSGGKSAAQEMSGEADDAGALNRQNEAYLQTVAGMIKQLDEDFQNLGSTLQRLGAFDAIGILAKSLDALLKTFNSVFGAISSFMDKNPVTSGLMKWSTVILEAAAAWKLFGGAATRALAGAGVLRNLTPTNQAEINAATAANEAGVVTPVPAAQYGRARFSTVAGAVRSRIMGLGAGYVDRYYNPTLAEQPLAGFHPSNLGLGRLADLRSLPGALSNFDTRQFIDRARFGRVVNPESEGFQFRGGDVRSALREQAKVVDAARTNGLIKPGESVTPLSSTATEADVKALRDLGLSAQSSSVLIRTSAAEQAVAMNSLSVRMRTFATGLAGSIASFAAMAGLMAAVGFALNQMSKASSDASSRHAAQQAILQGSTSSKDLATIDPTKVSFTDWYLGSSSTNPLAQAGNAVAHTLEGAYNLTLGNLGLPKFQGGQSGPSDESQNLLLDLSTKISTGGSTLDKNARKGFNDRISSEGLDSGFAGSVVEKLPVLGTVKEVQQWKKAEQEYIDKHAKDIEEAGDNNDNSQAQIAYQINQLKVNLDHSAQRRIAVLQGLNEIDILNANQIQALSAMASTLGGANANTLATQRDAVRTLIDETGLPTGGLAYKNLRVAAGSGGPVNTIGTNANGEIGSYSADGKWHPVSNRQAVNIGQSASSLPNLGNGPGVHGGEVRLQALQDDYQEMIDNAQSKLATGGLTKEDRAAYTQMLSQGLSGFQQIVTQRAQAPITQAQGRASLLASLAGTPWAANQLGLGTVGRSHVQTDTRAAAAALKKANDELLAYNSTLEATDPQYWSNLQQIQANKVQIAQLQFQPILGQLAVEAAQATDATEQANLKYQQAVKTLREHQAGGASPEQINSDAVAIASSGVDQRRTAEQVSEARAEANASGIQNSISKGQAQLAEALRLEGVYAKGGSLADESSYLHALSQANQARISIQDAIESQTQSAYDATAAWQKLNGHPLDAAYTELAKANQAYGDAVNRFGAQSQQAQTAWGQIADTQMNIRQMIEDNTQATYDVKASVDRMHGDSVRAAAELLAKAQQLYRYSVRQYGKDSSQANQAMAQANDAQQQLIQAQLDQVNSFLDLDISNLNSRGKTGDAEKAAQDAVTKVRNQIQSYLKHGGQKGTKQYNDLMGQLAQAQRSAFDTALHAQLDTLDFQQQTYQITSAEEVRSLQQILKNKQLTLQEQRDITLKIKNLQDSIREQLTQGGLNIPSDIKLPTAYEVRRSLGAGFAGAGTQVNTVNNNQQVTMYNSVPNQQVATTIANNVIQLINQQTSLGLRANSSTPRTVQTK